MYELKVDGMTCGHCVKAVTSSVLELDRTAEVTVDLASKTVRVASSAELDAVKGAISEAGYSVLESKLV